METSIRQIGNSVGAIIPADILKKLDVSIGEKLDVEVRSGKIILSIAKPVYALDDLIKQCDLSAPPVQESDWLVINPVGKEEW